MAIWNPGNCFGVLLLSLFFFLRILAVVSFSTVGNFVPVGQATGEIFVFVN